LPLDPRIQVRGLNIPKCKYMDSKKKPLWLNFQNAEANAENVYIIFKAGDDLRQDVLTLQMIRLMDKLWKEEGGLDLLLLPYKCISTGHDIGMIEVVLNSETTAAINKERSGAISVLQKDTLLKWLEKNNPSSSEKQKAIDTFVLSCAGYCVATYVLGVGDRHNDNIMMSRTGNLFHIDFGHFLGNYKKKFGIKRERAPFIFTPQYAAVMGGSNAEPFKKFEEVCFRAYNIIRSKARLFICLFEMMLSTGIPELQEADDIIYLRDAFFIDYSDEDAKKHFKSQISKALNTKTTQAMDIIHIVVHNK